MEKQELVILYVHNEYSIYRMYEWLMQCLVKKMRKGIQPDTEKLAKSSAMYTLTRLAINRASAGADCAVHFTPAERLALHREIAAELVDDAEEANA